MTRQLEPPSQALGRKSSLLTSPFLRCFQTSISASLINLFQMVGDTHVVTPCQVSVLMTFYITPEVIHLNLHHHIPCFLNFRAIRSKAFSSHIDLFFFLLLPCRTMEPSDPGLAAVSQLSDSKFQNGGFLQKRYYNYFRAGRTSNI